MACLFFFFGRTPQAEVPLLFFCDRVVKNVFFLGTRKTACVRVRSSRGLFPLFSLLSQLFLLLSPSPLVLSGRTGGCLGFFSVLGNHFFRARLFYPTHNRGVFYLDSGVCFSPLCRSFRADRRQACLRRKVVVRAFCISFSFLSEQANTESRCVTLVPDLSARTLTTRLKN